MSIKYKCLILDHDDTAVESTASIHYPAHLEIMQLLRPKHPPVSLEGWFQKNYTPGIFEYYAKELGFNEEEMKIEYDVWRQHTQTKIPDFYDGFLDLLSEYKRRGGIITVVSHSDKDIIAKHYSHHSDNDTIQPEIIFGWDNDKEKRKPNPYPAQSILNQLDLPKEDALILDDLKPGAEMGRASGVAVAGAGWGHQIPEIADDMKNSCSFYFRTIQEFRDFLFE